MGKDVIIACDFSSKADVMAFLDKLCYNGNILQRMVVSLWVFVFVRA